MNFISIVFYLFFIVVLALYRLTPEGYRYIVLLIASYVFYGYGSVYAIPVLLGVTVWTFFGGKLIEKTGKKYIFWIFFLLNIAGLVTFKFGKTLSMDLALPIGMSFYVFQSCGYLNDVYRRHMPAERNFLRYAAFVSFFPTVLSGPIQRSRELLPAIRSGEIADSDEMIKGWVLFAWGVFEKTVVSERLLTVVVTGYDEVYLQGTAYLLMAAIAFSLYIYADFSAYSDMARGIGKALGFEVGKNFRNPYLSTSLTEFWTRWHTSLNNWFLENVYIPLGGNRKGKFRKYLHIMIVFTLSGIWHGTGWHFLIWGVLNGVLVVIGQVLRPFKLFVYRKAHVDEELTSILFIRRVITFWIITLTWVFFQNGTREAIYIIRHIILFSPTALFSPDLLVIGGDAVRTVITFLAAAFFCYIQIRRKEESECWKKFKREPRFFQCVSLALLLVVSLFSSFGNNIEQVGTQFLYFQF